MIDLVDILVKAIKFVKIFFWQNATPFYGISYLVSTKLLIKFEKDTILIEGCKSCHILKEKVIIHLV